MTDTSDAPSSSDSSRPTARDRLDDDLLDTDVLVTGFPGFIATRLVREMLEYEPSGEFVFLVEDRFEEEAESRLSHLASELPHLEGRWEVVVGDITDEQLDLAASTYDELTDRIGMVWHLAAIYDLAVEESIAYEVNVRGTIHVLDFCEACDDLRRFNYVSTCYVSGLREDTVYEDELDEGQSHKNHYESTKFWAEVEVQRRWNDLPTAIFRPGIVVGDSRTGETDKYDGPYYLFKALDQLPDWVPVPNLGRGDCVVNLVPVDYATRSMATIGYAEDAEETVYQVADPNPMRARDIFSLALDALGRAPSVGSIPAGLAEFAMESETLEARLGMPKEALDYFNHGARYDTSNTDRALQGTSIHCPHLSTYFQTLVDYYRRHPEP